MTLSKNLPRPALGRLLRTLTFATMAVFAWSPVQAANVQVGAVVDGQLLSRTLTFGIVPQQSASRLAQMWGPLLQQIHAETGIALQFQTTKDIPTFEACLASGAFDIAYMNPVHYTIFAEHSGYRALARQRDKRLHGLLVVHKDSELASIHDLAGAQIAFPSPGAFGASVLPRAELRADGIDFTPNYVKSHDSVYRAVAAGIVQAGGGVERTFNAVDPAIRNQLRVIYRTDGYTPHAIAGLRGLPDGVGANIRDALLRISARRPELAASVGMQGFQAAEDADWDDVRGLSLGAHQTGIEATGGGTCPSG